MIWELSILSHVLGLTDTSAGLAIIELAASASFNMALTFSLGNGLCANVRLEKLWSSLHAKQISSPSGLRPKRPRMMPPNWKKVIWSLEFAADRYQPNLS